MNEMAGVPKGHHIIEIVAGATAARARILAAPARIRCACAAVFGDDGTYMGGVAELYAVHIANVALEQDQNHA